MNKAQQREKQRNEGTNSLVVKIRIKVDLQMALKRNDSVILHNSVLSIYTEIQINETDVLQPLWQNMD